MIYKDYYKDLGLTPSATPAEIKKAYRTLAKKYHPDKARGDKKSEEKFKEVNEANEVLSDAAKRKKYDQFGAEWKQYEQAGSRPGGFDWSKYPGAGGNTGRQSRPGPTEQGMDDDTVNDLFEMLFGQRSGGRQRRRAQAFAGTDVTAEALLTLEEAYHGTVRIVQRNGQTIKVTLKPGIADRQSLKVEGKGSAGSGGGPDGDLIITVKVAADPLHVRNGNDLHRTLLVPLYTAVLGGKVPVAAMKGKIMVSIPPGTPNGKELRLVGLGMPVYGRAEAFGDLFVNVQIVLPSLLSDEETALFTTLASLRPDTDAAKGKEKR
jgi:curved DNA-binding protein